MKKVHPLLQVCDPPPLKLNVERCNLFSSIRMAFLRKVPLTDRLTDRQTAIEPFGLFYKQNLKNSGTKGRGQLPLFMVTFDNSEDPNKIYSLGAILNMRVKVKALRKVSHLISQCQRVNPTQSIVIEIHAMCW